MALTSSVCLLAVSHYCAVSPFSPAVTPNITRFFVLCSSTTAASVSFPSGDDKTAILLVCNDRPGSLRDVLDAFARHDVNLTHIDRRPCPLPTLARLISFSTAGPGQGLTLGRNALGLGGAGHHGASASGSVVAAGTPLPVGALSSSSSLSSTSTPRGAAGSPANVNGSGSTGYLPALAGPHGAAVAASSSSSPTRSSIKEGLNTGSSSSGGAEAGVAAAPAACAGSDVTVTSSDSEGAVIVPRGVAPSLIVPSLIGGRGSATSQFGQAFFVEALGHTASPGMAAALAEASEYCLCIKVLGSFPRARRVL